MFGVGIKSEAFANTVVSLNYFVLFCLFYFCHNTKVISILISCKLALFAINNYNFTKLNTKIKMRLRNTVKIR